jgi:hypothetical protein
MSGVIGVVGLTADYPAAPLGTFVLAALPEQDLKPADNQTVGERTQVARNSAIREFFLSAKQLVSLLLTKF